MCATQSVIRFFFQGVWALLGVGEGGQESGATLMIWGSPLSPVVGSCDGVGLALGRLLGRFGVLVELNPS